jgi:hypothetical protein
MIVIVAAFQCSLNPVTRRSHPGRLLRAEVLWDALVSLGSYRSLCRHVVAMIRIAYIRRSIIVDLSQSQLRPLLLTPMPPFVARALPQGCVSASRLATRRHEVGRNETIYCVVFVWCEGKRHLHVCMLSQVVDLMLF